VADRPRVAHVITESNLGGAQRNTLLTLRGLLGADWDVELIAGDGGGGALIAEARRLGVVAHVVPDLVRPVDGIRDVRALVALYRLCRQRRYDIVHTHSTKAGLLGRAAAWSAGVPVIVHTVHGAPFEIRGDARSRVFLGLERLAARVTDRLVCVGEAFREEVVSWRIASDVKLVTVYSGVDFGALVPRRTVAETKRALALDGAWPVVGCVGRLSEQKAQHALVEAVAALRTAYPGIRLLLVGDGPLRPVVEATSRRLGCADAVALLGERDDVADLLEVFDIYAMSSRWEGVGRALTEAMACGRPVVATDVDGVREIVVHERTGLLVPSRDPTALAAAIDRLAADGALAQRLGAAARLRVRALMRVDRMIADLDALYRGLLVPAHPHAAPADAARAGRERSA
jgi:glycosyltransferase involved in cell wall biosynthesis